MCPFYLRFIRVVSAKCRVHGHKPGVDVGVMRDRIEGYDKEESNKFETGGSAREDKAEILSTYLWSQSSVNFYYMRMRDFPACLSE